MIRVIRYDTSLEETWNECVANSKAGTLLHRRSFMEYHADRFIDHSLLLFEEDELLGVLPANISESQLISHAGLSYGGLIYGKALRTTKVIECLHAVLDYLRSHSVTDFIYKSVPSIYRDSCSSEDEYALFYCGFSLYRRDLSATLDLRVRSLPYSKGRKALIARARQLAMEISETSDYDGFVKILNARLTSKYGKMAVHTAAELVLLQSRFPEQIRLHACHYEGRMIGGILVFEARSVAHCQYIAFTEEGDKMGSRDFLIDHLISEYRRREFRFFDFGPSTEQDGRYLNIGLCAYKEGFGARATVNDFYRITP